MRAILFSLMCFSWVSAVSADVLVFPSKVSPGKAFARSSGGTYTLSNAVVAVKWTLSGKGFFLTTVTNRLTGQVLKFDSPVFQARFKDGTVSSANVKPAAPIGRLNLKGVRGALPMSSRYPGVRLKAKFEVDGVTVLWTAELRDGSNYVKQNVSVMTAKPRSLKSLAALNASVSGAKCVGKVNGSPVVVGDIFLGVAHPISRNTVDGGGVVRCARDVGIELGKGKSFSVESLVGVCPKGQLRRGFLYCLERERAHPYRFYLHYNSWFDLNIDRPGNRMTEKEALESVKMIGDELVKKRGVKMNGFVMDDGWDSHVKVWHFHDGFPNGFKKIGALAKSYGAGVGVWMSPWGGYAQAKSERLKSGAKMGLECNGNGFSMAGPNYRKLFVSTAEMMMKKQGVNFFKFDGMGGGGSASAADIEAVLDMSKTLRKINPDVFISATVGTWPSPFWTFYADSIWRQGADFSTVKPGNPREGWITYRDTLTYGHIVSQGPLYPLNSLMFHGVIVSKRGGPGGMPLDENSFRHEVRAAFGCGSGLQELYITPSLLTKRMWDDLAAAAKWARANINILVDTHWVGGNPEKREVYGWASWNRGKGVLVLRNPSDKKQTFTLDVGKVFELPKGAPRKYSLTPSYPDQKTAVPNASAGSPVKIELAPFDVLVFNAKPLSRRGLRKSR